ncbi:MAG: zonular occludens toxin domain-containing protein [Pseudomonadota bacterium]
MAGWIFHGPPGSYKTSSAVWYEALPALRKGRIVITNIEGIKPVDEIEEALGEKFEEGADIWRVSTLKDKGRELMRSFYHWAPIGAMIIIDEVQDVYPTDRRFKPEEYDYKHIDTIKDDVPIKYYEEHKKRLDDIRPADLTSEDIDDLEQQIFDENGHIIYPSTLKEAFMRHRKYNWDILVCTPDITEINTIVRSACEVAFQHASKDKFGQIIPYYKRRPRIKQHPVKENGMMNRKSDIIEFRKVPVDVHKLYKSTATGKVTASGVGKTPLTSGPFIFTALVLASCLGYLIYAIAFYENVETKDSATGAQTGEKSGQSSGPVARKVADVPGYLAVDEADMADYIRLALPNEPNEIYISGSNNSYKNGKIKELNLLFELQYQKGIAYITNHELKQFDIAVLYVSDCHSKLTFRHATTNVFCKLNPVTDNRHVITNRPEVSVF